MFIRNMNVEYSFQTTEKSCTNSTGEKIFKHFKRQKYQSPMPCSVHIT